MAQRLKNSGNGVPRLLREIAYERLKESIRNGVLQPGEPLSETSVSEELNISRTPVREAIQQLAQEGLVQVLPNRAVTVAALTFEEVMNVLHVRILLEPEIARLSAESMSDKQLKKLLKAMEEMESAAERDERTQWSRWDHVWHETLAEACPNSLLGKLGLGMRDRIQHLAVDAQTPGSRLLACTEEHRAVVEAILKKDGGAARDGMRHHLEQLRKSFFHRLIHS